MHHKNYILHHYINKRNPKNIGGMIIRGISNAGGEYSDEDDEDEEEEQVTSKYTAEQMSSLRYVFITQKREDKNEMRRFILRLTLLSCSANLAHTLARAHHRDVFT